VVLTLPEFHAPVGRARWGRRSTGPSRRRLRQRGEHLVVLQLPRGERAPTSAAKPVGSLCSAVGTASRPAGSRCRWVSLVG